MKILFRLRYVFAALLLYVLSARAANEITVQASLGYVNTPFYASLQTGQASPQGVFSITGKNFVGLLMSIPTTAGGTAIPVTGLSTLGWAAIKNNDTTNYVDILTAVSGTAFLRLMPGECVVFRFNPAITAPAALAHTAAVEVQYLILEN